MKYKSKVPTIEVVLILVFEFGVLAFYLFDHFDCNLKFLFDGVIFYLATKINFEFFFIYL